MPSQLASLKQWVDDVARLTQPDQVHWCDGSDAENARLVELMLANDLAATLEQATDKLLLVGYALRQMVLNKTEMSA